MSKFILDVCCGGRQFWFNKKHPNVIYIDKRKTERGLIKDRPNFVVDPDQIMDFRKLEFKDSSFKLVVWDPPHLKSFGENSYMRKKYGVLFHQSWEQDFRHGFKEIWRVLQDFGVLIFKWNEEEIKLSEVLEQFSEVPLFGHTTGSKSKTKWLCFMKIPK